MQNAPELMQKAGLAIRPALEEDLLFVFRSWTTSGLKPFMAGGPCPWPSAAGAVAAARARGHTALLLSIYSREQQRLIRGALASCPTLVVYDTETPSFIIGWGNRHYCYVKQAFRGQGIARVLRAALDAR